MEGPQYTDDSESSSQSDSVSLETLILSHRNKMRDAYDDNSTNDTEYPTGSSERGLE
jgi:hypothetical protein